MSDESPAPREEDVFYTLVPEQGLCLIGDAIVNLGAVSLIRKVDGATLVYPTGASEPVSLPGGAFERIREAVFSIDDLDALDGLDGEDDFDDEEEG